MKRMLAVLALFGASAMPAPAMAGGSVSVGVGVFYSNVPSRVVYGAPVVVYRPPPTVLYVVPRQVAWSAKTPVALSCEGKKAGEVFACNESKTGKCICQ